MVSSIPAVFSYSVGNSKYEVDIIKLVIGLIIIVFAFIDLIPRLQKLPNDTYGLIGAAIIAAFAGSFIGARLVKKVTLIGIQVIVGVMLIIVGLGMLSGLV